MTEQVLTYLCMQTPLLKVQSSQSSLVKCIQVLILKNSTITLEGFRVPTLDVLTIMIS